MSKLTDQLRERGIFNEFGILAKFGSKGKTDIVCSYRPRPEGRMGMAQCSKTVVASPSHKTRPDAPWYNNGCQTFIGKRSESFSLALSWASHTYGITEWDKAPFSLGDRIPKSVLDAAKAWLKQPTP